MNWPPVYTIKPHPRARGVKLKASIKKGLEIVTPPRFNLKHIPDIVEKNKSWIIKQLQKIHEKTAQIKHDELPLTISLQAIPKNFTVQYIASSNKKLQLFVRPENEIVIMGDVTNKTLCKKLLRAWIQAQAKEFLQKTFDHLSKEINLPYNQLSFRNQETRWGSCSSEKNISLNYKLISLPIHLVRYIMIHELCHTIHLNHSQRFWKLVASFEPNWRKCAQEIRVYAKENSLSL